MRIAIIGSGNVGSTVARGWASRGHTITYGVREPKEGAGAVKGGLPAGARVTDVAEAVRGAEVVLLATPARAVADAAETMRAGLAQGTIVIDATNPVGAGVQLETGPKGESQGERTQALLPNARVVKSLNQTGAENMNPEANKAFRCRPVMFVAGDDAEARGVVHGLVEELGFQGIEAGPLVRARELERLAILWISLAMNQAIGLGRNFSFAVPQR